MVDLGRVELPISGCKPDVFPLALKAHGSKECCAISIFSTLSRGGEMRSDEYDGRARNVFPTKCRQCGEEFFVPKHRLEKARFCSKKCSSTAKSQAASITAECAQCGKTLIRKQSRMLNSKSGLLFCDRTCKEAAQRIGGVVAIQPSHYGTTKTDYRETALRGKLAKCEVCGYSEVPEVLVVHHIDVDRTNNEELNLQVLCPTCHAVIHFRTRTGYWRTR